MTRAGCITLAVALAVPIMAQGAMLPDVSSVSTGLPLAQAMARDLYVAKVMEEAREQGVPPALADAVAVVESGYNALARGTSGEVGLMQILPATAAMLGFTGSTSELFVPPTNIHYGVAYLARAWAMSGGSVCRALMKYRAGWGQEAFSPLSITYCARASAYLDGADMAIPELDAPPARLAAADTHVVAIGAAPRKAAYMAPARPSAEQQTSALATRWNAHRRHF